MPWKETSPGHFTRPFDSIENFFKAISAAGLPLKREHMTLSAAVRCRLDPSLGDIEATLLNAWKTMRFDYPQIAAYAKDDVYNYDVPDAAALESWVTKTFIFAPASATTAELCANCPLNMLATLHYLPHTSELLLRSSHWRIDGVGSMNLLNHLLRPLAAPRAVQFGSEGKNLRPALDEAANVPTETTPEMEQAAMSRIMEFVQNVPSIGLPTSSNQIPAATRRCEIELTPELTSDIVARCKARDLSVTTAVHAAIVCVTQALADPAVPAKAYASFLNFDLRKYCPAQYNGANNPVAIYLTGLPVIVSPSSFSGNASQLQRIYSKSLSSPDSSIFDYLAYYHNKVCAVFTAPPPEGTIAPSEPGVSSLGIADQIINAKHGEKIEVLDLWLGVEMLTRQFMTYLWTFQGRMKISVCYNESFYEKDYAQAFLERVEALLVQELGS